MIYAVIDTNVIVSALISKNPLSATVKVFQAFMERSFRLLINEDIIEEYQNVLSRPKFKISSEQLSAIIAFIREEGIMTSRVHSEEFFPDADDAVFYEVALSKENAYVVTGNLKHFPKTPIVITPAEMLQLL